MDGFIANLYEFWGGLNLGGFSADMYNFNFYLPIFIVMLASVMVVAAIYYYVVNHPRVNRWYHWLCFNIGTSVLNFALAWIIASDKLFNLWASQGMACPYDWTNYFSLACMAFVWTFVFFFLFSFIIKWGSRNCKHTPFL